MTTPVASKISVEDVKIFPLRTFDALGTLVFAENHAPVPFAMARVFSIVGVPAGGSRGNHAHRECQHAVVCLRGVCRVLCKDGRHEKTFELTSPAELLHVPAMIWASETYVVEGTVLMVLADQPYAEEDYIRDYDEYLRLRGIEP